MQTVAVQILNTIDEDLLPSYASIDSAGLDLKAAHEAIIAPGQRQLVKTGLFMAIPSGYEGQVRPRSGLALKHGVTVLNAPGTIDADYRGEVGVILVNHGSQDMHIERGMRIAQLIVAPVVRADIRPVNALDDTDRGSGGFGSSGSR